MTEGELDTKKVDGFFRGEYTEEGSRYLEEMFCDKHREEELEHFLKKQWYEFLKEDNGSEKNLDTVLYEIHYNINSRFKESRSALSVLFRRVSRIAAILLLPLTLYFGLHFFWTLESGELSWVEIKAPAWTRTKFDLPDGSHIWLNSNSSIRYKNNFSFKRELYLDGEAFFDVIEYKGRPFTVNTSDVLLTVLGTKFNVASYENEDNIEVVLEEGELLFSDGEMNRSCLMKPNDLLIYNKNKKEYTAEVVMTEKYSSWIEGKLIFRNDPLDIIARRLERWYNIIVDIKGDNVTDLRLRATFIDENLNEVLYYLKRSLPIDYSINGGNIDIDNTLIKKHLTITIINQKPE